MSPTDTLPPFLYGTAWKEERTGPLVELALRQGFRGIDTANQRKHYNEAAVGEALAREIAAGTVAREELFLQTKFTQRPGQDQRLPYDPAAPVGKQVRQSFASSLEHLRTSYLDSYLLHGPSQRSGLAEQDWEAWTAMEALHAEGNARALGVSNFSHEQLELLLDRTTVRPAFVQNRCFAAIGWDWQVRQLCQGHGIAYQGFSLLTANREIWLGQRVAEVGDAHSLTPAQVIFCLALELGMLPLTGTSDAAHMADALACRTGVLAAAEVAELEAIALRQG
ncbi:MAG: aldo/keto reductase [Methanobacteriota archaeon]|uniref:Aldo/keto reductase n=1 Tax=Marine Group III euryarchaeote TaxID=2173149 RepID=A0A7C8DF74_9ARCH|nr:MAG: aldo/keto reductase [Euryarchaeota archaeon]HIG63348.1 aldo/keto reductase [Marine Group III euryarchaeote]HIL32983.1 aldo/keto reductase [Candidatus Poseidoniales archaeon]